MAAMEYEDIELQLITGSRNNLVAVNDGDQYRLFINTKGIQFERLIAPYRQAWTCYAEYIMLITIRIASNVWNGVKKPVPHGANFNLI